MVYLLLNIDREAAADRLRKITLDPSVPSVAGLAWLGITQIEIDRERSDVSEKALGQALIALQSNKGPTRARQADVAKPAHLRLVKAEETAAQALAAFEKSKNVSGQGQAHLALSELRFYAGDAAGGEQHLEAARSRFQAIRYRQGLMQAAIVRAAADVRLNRVSQAV